MASSIRLCLRSAVAFALKPKRRFSLQLSVVRPFFQPFRSTFPIQGLVSTLRAPLSILLPIMAASGDNKQLIEEVEALYEKKEFDKMYDLLIPHKDTTDADVLWRLARAATEVGKARGGEERQAKIFEAFGYSTRALELDDKNFACHKWYGILLDYTAEYEGTKQRISNAYKVKEHFMKAIELNPKDATTMYCLGLWCFLFADMPWYQRKVASVIFASPPTSTYDEALGYFKQAEEAEPGFYNQNRVMMGKTYMRLKDKEAAKDHLLTALKYEDKTVDDAQARKDALDLLKQLGVKV
ncbi:regulator of microtubule dynamics protein 1 [Aplysia californica]|uniref:Regulator of microtubule dynamics protein 1 n=1 Tax=Aplysia californica TaxID=6500 RepID=A0ABM1ACD7_APLCA|nr:regulator of microtubule dynamics protein 1 [Aplysia californica]